MQVILVDLTFLPIIGRIWQQLPGLRAVVVLTDRCARVFFGEEGGGGDAGLLMGCCSRGG